MAYLLEISTLAQDVQMVPRLLPLPQFLSFGVRHKPVFLGSFEDFSSLALSRSAEFGVAGICTPHFKLHSCWNFVISYWTKCHKPREQPTAADQEWPQLSSKGFEAAAGRIR